MNNSSFVHLIFKILKFRKIGRSKFGCSKCWPAPLLYPIFRHPHKNKIYIQHTQLFGTKIYFDSIRISVKYMYVKYIFPDISQFYKENMCKIYFNYITFFENIYKIYIFSYIFTYMSRIYFSIWELFTNEHFFSILILHLK